MCQTRHGVSKSKRFKPITCCEATAVFGRTYGFGKVWWLERTGCIAWWKRIACWWHAAQSLEPSARRCALSHVLHVWMRSEAWTWLKSSSVTVGGICTWWKTGIAKAWWAGILAVCHGPMTGQGVGVINTSAVEQNSSLFSAWLTRGITAIDQCACNFS